MATVSWILQLELRWFPPDISNPLVVKAIQEQAEKFIHISSDFYHPVWVELAEKINEIGPIPG